MPADKPRFLHDNRDMALSMIPLILGCLIIAALAGQCSFKPGGPSRGQIPHFDAVGALEYDAARLDFPVRLPSVPQGWQSNSGNNDPVPGTGGGESTTVGWITDAGRYIRLTQSDATEDALVPFIAGNPRGAGGVAQVDGTSWVIYADANAEPIWLADLGTVRLAISGAGSEPEFMDLATATTGAHPLAQ